MDRAEKILLSLMAAAVLVITALQIGLYKGRMLQRERLVTLQAENADLKDGISDMTMELTRRCWPVWEGEKGHETASRMD